jgi:hypothetical protein
MKIAKCITTAKLESYFPLNTVKYIPLDALTMVHKNGKTIAELLGLKIENTFQKTIAYDESTTRLLLSIAEDYIVYSTRKINKEIYGMVNAISLSDVQLCSESELKKVREDSDRELNHLCRKVGTWNGKASDVYIQALAKQA